TKQAPCMGGVTRGSDQKIVAQQKAAQEAADTLVIIDDQNMGRGLRVGIGHVTRAFPLARDTGAGFPGPSSPQAPGESQPPPAVRRHDRRRAYGHAAPRTAGVQAARPFRSGKAAARAGHGDQYGFQPARPRSRYAAHGSATAWSHPAHPAAPSPSDLARD